MSVEVEVLLATYRAGPFLIPMLDSLFSQRDVDMRIIARDDGSDDGTAEMLDTIEGRAGGRLRVLRDGRRGLGAAGNFSELMASSRAPFVALADQDDVWHPTKLASELSTVRIAELGMPRSTPVLVHGDLRVVDADLGPISPSFAKMQCLDLVAGSTFRRLLMQNVVTGCTIMANRALIEMALPVPKEAIMHDHWLALVASGFGRCVVQQGDPLIDYRQHGRNTIGAKQFSAADAMFRPSYWRSDRLRASLTLLGQQATVFGQRYGTALGAVPGTELTAFLEMLRTGFLRRRWILIRRGFWKHGWMQNAGLLARL